MEWVRILAYITGTVDQELLLRNEYLVTENRILRTQIKGRLLLTDAEKRNLADIGHRLGRQALKDVAKSAKPDTILGWYRRLVARKFDGSKARRYPGRPRVDREIEDLVVRIAKENNDWGYDRIVGPLTNLGYTVSDETVGNILRRYGIPPAPERKRTTTWKEFIHARMAVLAGTDFFTVEVLTLRGLVTYYVLFFIHLESRRYLIHDRDAKYTDSFRAIVRSGQVEPLKLPARSPNLNAYAERWVKSVKDECLSKLILFGEASLRRALQEYVAHHHTERNHQGKGNVLLFPTWKSAMNHVDGSVGCKERLGGLLKYYHREAAVSASGYAATNVP